MVEKIEKICEGVVMQHNEGHDVLRIYGHIGLPNLSVVRDYLQKPRTERRLKVDLTDAESDSSNLLKVLWFCGQNYGKRLENVELIVVPGSSVEDLLKITSQNMLYKITYPQGEPACSYSHSN